MTENTTKHLYRIIKRIHNKKVVKLLVQQVKYPHRIFLAIKVTNEDSVPEVLHRTPEWVKDFVDKLNKEEVRFVK